MSLRRDEVGGDRPPGYSNHSTKEILQADIPLIQLPHSLDKQILAQIPQTTSLILIPYHNSIQF